MKTGYLRKCVAEREMAEDKLKQFVEKMAEIYAKV